MTTWYIGGLLLYTGLILWCGSLLGFQRGLRIGKRNGQLVARRLMS